MQRWKELPGFRTYRDFFAVLPRDYENIVPEDRLKRSLIDAIPKIELIDDDSYWFDRIRREPSEMVDHCMSDILDDWHESAVVREVRQFPMRQGREGVFAFGSETYYVRFEVASLYPRGVWGSPIALMMVADAFYRPMSYTFIYGNGRLQNGVSCRSCYGVGDSVAAAQRDFALLECGDVLEVSNADKFSERIAIRSLGSDDGYDLCWCSHDYPWYFALDGACKEVAETFLLSFCSDGLRAVQDMLPWRVMNRREAVLSGMYYDSDKADGAKKVRAKRRKPNNESG